MQISQEIENHFAKLQDTYFDDINDLNVTIQLNLQGEGGGRFVLRLNQGRLTIRAGDSVSPDLAVTITGEDFLLTSRGEIDPLGLVLKGQLKLEGDRLLAMKVATILQNV